MRISFFLVVLCLFSGFGKAQTNDNKSANVDFDYYEKLVSEVKKYRKNRLVNLDEFLKLSSQENVIILDTRSDKMYESKHIEGAVHLNFSDFNQKNLANIITSLDTKILIYCNNNFQDDQKNFAAKAIPKTIQKFKMRELTLSLNIPTFINLYGYGYKNVYELSERISVFDERIKFSGTSVLK